MSLDGSSVVRLLDNLEEAGLIQRKEGETDRRAKIILLTPRGRAIAEQGRGGGAPRSGATRWPASPTGTSRRRSAS